MAITDKKMIEPSNGFELQDLRDEHIHKASFKGSHFEGIDMRDTIFEHVNFVQAKWEHIYFAGLHIKGIQMGGTIFENIIRPQSEQSELSAEPGTAGWVNVEPVQFKNSDLSTATFENCNLKDVELNNCQIEGLRINGILLTDLLTSYSQSKD